MDYIAYKNFGAWLVPAYLVTDFINPDAARGRHDTSLPQKRRQPEADDPVPLHHHRDGDFTRRSSCSRRSRTTVLEGIVSVSLLAVLAAILYGKDARAKKGQERRGPDLIKPQVGKGYIQNPGGGPAGQRVPEKQSPRAGMGCSSIKRPVEPLHILPEQRKGPVAQLGKGLLLYRFSG